MPFGPLRPLVLVLVLVLVPVLVLVLVGVAVAVAVAVLGSGMPPTVSAKVERGSGGEALSPLRNPLYDASLGAVCVRYFLGPASYVKQE